MTNLTRSAALARATAFQPRMGRAYAGTRNTDLGPGQRDNVSALSPHVRRRLVLEEELVAMALAAHGPAASEKFVQEVIWRSYFKGWLEHRPSVWAAYRAGLEQDRARLETDDALRARHAQALSGQSGFACLDAWVEELRDTGYLHNHARMWFASIWIFSLGLPWRLGAAFFLRHLLDGDPASNTLGWRWVAGLHTPGKHYVARADNIARHSGGRFAETPGLARNPAPLKGEANPERTPLRQPRAPQPGRPTLLLITEEDCSALHLPKDDVVGIATLQLSDLRGPDGASQAVRDADASALRDAAGRLGGARQIVTPFLPVGWVRDWMDSATPVLTRHGLPLTEVQRDWDAAFWPLATAGFFKLKKAIPRTLEGLGIARTPGPEGLPLFARSG
ncbi:FAD-binding domain-containing protein [Oceanibium sediminis]|uniref:FAD-binding domain-containing protein n=1 Tax=Oceanibium sediminis TaxID=2026339 RepID=UPI000DD4769E|nr:FAD-binding domain-containing protein [Oceanibium sediminis]